MTKFHKYYFLFVFHWILLTTPWSGSHISSNLKTGKVQPEGQGTCPRLPTGKELMPLYPILSVFSNILSVHICSGHKTLEMINNPWQCKLLLCIHVSYFFAVFSSIKRPHLNWQDIAGVQVRGVYFVMIRKWYIWYFIVEIGSTIFCCNFNIDFLLSLRVFISITW